MHSPFPSALNRRAFLRRSTVLAAGIAFPFIAKSTVRGANGRLNVAGIVPLYAERN